VDVVETCRRVLGGLGTATRALPGRSPVGELRRPPLRARASGSGN